MRLVFLIFLLASVAGAQELTITAAEYYWDSDPGAGNGTPLSVIARDTVAVSATYDPSGLSIGIHTFFIRYLGSNGQWSVPEGNPVDVSPNSGSDQQIVAAEYFYDTDPGQNAGQPLSFIHSDNVTVSAGVTANSLSVGLHNVFVRYRSANGAWSMAYATPFAVDAPSGTSNLQLAGAEYFFDTDPGQGLGTPISFSQSDTVTVVAQPSVNTLSLGVHTAYIRYRSSIGQWSMAYATPFLIYAVAGGSDLQITSAEYYWDTDPGVGNAHGVDFADSSNVFFFHADSLALTQGMHTLYVRYHATNGQWSAAEGNPVFIAPLMAADSVRIVGGQSAIDVDPGPGNGRDMIPNDGVFDSKDEVMHRFSTGNLYTLGRHYVYTRIWDSRGLWSTCTKDSFTVSGPMAITTVANATGASDSLRLDWSNFPETTEYRVHRDPLVNGPFINYLSVPGTDTTEVVEIVNGRGFLRVKAMLPDTAH